MQLSSFHSSIVRRVVPVLGALVAVAAVSCATTEAPPERVGHDTSAAFVNGGFETGMAGQVPPSPWALTEFLNPNPNGYTVMPQQTFASLNLVSKGMACTTNNQCDNGFFGTCQNGFCSPSAKTVILNGNNQPDPTLGPTASLRWPRYGSQCALVNQLGNLSNVNELSQSMTVDSSDVDPADGQVHVRFVVAPVLEDPGHAANQEPYFYVQLTNVTQGNTVLYSNFNFANQSGVPWLTTTAGGNTYRYTDWQLVDITGANGALNMGDSLTLQLIAAGCSLGGHMGELYVDGVGSTVPGLYLSGSGPAQANAGANITYTLTYRNGGAAAATGVVATFNTPPNTTYQSSTAPSGAICTTPLVGTAGAVTCAFSGSIPANGSGSYTITVGISGTATGSIVAGNYSIQSIQETALLGNKITTIVGCTADSQCPTGDWCNISGNLCTPTLANGTLLPTDTGHTNPTLNGMCTTQAGALVCTSTVCDTDNECGYANGDGSCTSANAATVCRSGACDPDTKCGYANGDGPCTTANAATVCRSGACSTNGKCEKAGGCNVDADCSAGNWCNESTSTCTATLANGTTIPTDPPHANPTLNGTCTTQAGALVCTSTVCDGADNKCGYANGDGSCTSTNAATVCRSGACDPDTKCGYANGDGPCTTANAAMVCRSGACSTNGKCEKSGGCNVDADCPAGDWCDESVSTCMTKLANGTVMPTDAPHTNPTLDGTCTTAAATLVCSSAVCDTDNKCGLATGDGPCTALTATVCRSGACSTNLKCEVAGGCNVDADCTGGKWCDESVSTCTATLPNGTAMPTDAPHTNPTLDGTCTATAGTLVCTSSVCDTKDSECGFANGDGVCSTANAAVVCRSAVCDPDTKCGYANGDGPCTTANAATVCRSGACSANGKCQPAGACNVDADCPTAHWCDESIMTCTPALANGTAMPVDAPHTNPTLDGTCTTAAATLVCASAVCDSADSKCGYANGDGTCTTANADTMCRSGVCDPDGKCGYANGDGTCTTANAGTMCRSGACDPDGKCGYANGDGPCTTSNSTTVCRSSACSTNGKCEVAGGCNIDADCSSGKWCDESVSACVAQLVNGTAMPTDSPHTNPVLDGTCTAGAGALVCVSSVCDIHDNACGYANGDGPCTTANAATVCRAGTCSPNGTCQPTGACNVDADCPTGNWCLEQSHTCKPKLANKAPLPSDPPHTNPTLDGTCTDAGAQVVCVSGVCDRSNSECGYANGSGPCTLATGPVLCQSGACSHGGTCVPPTGCNVDADCTAGNWCDETTHVCSAQLPNGAAMPVDTAHMNPTLTGNCSADAARLVCLSGVCDVKDNECGYANGDGPCSSVDGGATVCRSNACSINATCEPPSGCNIDPDCAGTPATPVCDLGSHMCRAPRDAGAPDATTPMDASNPPEASRPQPSDPGYAEGGAGCSVAREPGRGTPPVEGFALIALVVAAGAGRRSRRVREARHVRS